LVFFNQPLILCKKKQGGGRNKKKHFFFYKGGPPPPRPLENRAFYEMWKNILERGSPQMTIWRMRFARWITKATNIHSEYVILIASPQQHWLHGRASVLRYKYTDRVVTVHFQTW